MRSLALPFKDRDQAGELLARELKQRKSPFEHPIVLGLPRGGVPIAGKVAASLGALLDVIVVRKIGAPSNREYGIGAITEEGYYWVDHEIAQGVGISAQELTATVATKTDEIDDMIRRLRGGRPLTPVEGKSIIVVDDGIATGVTARVVADYLRTKGVRRITLAAPVCSADGAEMLSAHYDEVVCLARPRQFFAVGNWYDDFRQVTDEEVLESLQSRRPSAA